ncbi:MAG: ABC transporter permease, partial [Spirochaetales bacterium]
MSTQTIKKKRDVWHLVSLGVLILYGLFLLYPLFRLLRESVLVDGKFTFAAFKQFFSSPYHVETIFNSLKVSIAATAVSLIIGVPLAYFYQMYEIKGKSVLQVLVILCSMSAPFIGAYSWIMLLGRNGIITQVLAKIGISVGNIYGFKGILLVLSLQLFPLVFLYVCGAIKNIDNSLLEASQNMGCTGVKRFFTIVIPLCMPTIIAATLLVFMRAFADFGTPLLIGEGYQTFPVVIYDAYFAETGGDHTFGAAVAVIGICITALIFLFQNWVNSRHRFTMNAMHTIERKQAHGIGAFFMNLYCWLVVLISFLPQIYVIYSSFQKTSGKLFIEGYSLDSYKFAFTHLKKAIPNTFLIGLLALAIVIVLAILIAYLVVRRSNAANKVIDTISMVPY